MYAEDKSRDKSIQSFEIYARKRNSDIRNAKKGRSSCKTQNPSDTLKAKTKIKTIENFTGKNVNYF